MEFTDAPRVGIRDRRANGHPDVVDLSLPEEPFAFGPRKTAPPPLVLHYGAGDSGDLPVVASEGSTPSTTSLPYLRGASVDEHDGRERVDNEADDTFDNNYTRIRSPAESDKRGGGVFDDLDLGLEPSVEVGAQLVVLHR